MKISLEWMQDYVDLRGLSEKELSHALTMVGLEVEGVERVGLAPLHNVVVGQIVSFAQHPNADRLSLCQVDVGDGAIRSIVCGAKNFQAGDRVIVALPGAVLPGDFKIKESKLRGVMSQGMLCSERELGMGDDHAGIAILAGEPALGTPINEFYGEADLVFDLEVTPNRPDALCHIGVARELAAWFRRELKYPEVRINAVDLPAGRLVESVDSLNPEFCPHYRGYSIRGVRVAESPDWLKRRLTAIGLRPINNVVDITNFVLMETGQPLHAFDVKKIRGGRIVVRLAGEGEKITTLDGKLRQLLPGDLVIADAERPLVIAGVMGSLDAEVDASTTDIFLESAWFDPLTVRRTGKRLGLSTDSSYRFERGVDPKGAEFAALRCAELIVELAGGELLGPPLVSGQPPLSEQEILLSPDWVRARLGFTISDADMLACLERLELAVSETQDDDDKVLFKVDIPSFRQDLYRPIDLVEEIVRMYGSDRIPEGEIKATATLMDDHPVPVYQRLATAIMVGRGLHETIHYTMRSEAETLVWSGHASAEALALANPLASDASHLRVSLLPGLLDCLRLNASRQQTVYGLFECGRIFREHGGAVHEVYSVAFVLPQASAAGIGARQKADFFTAQRLVLDLLAAAGIACDPAQLQPATEDGIWQSGHAASVGTFQDQYEARMGLLDLRLTRGWDLEEPVVAGSVDILPEYFLQARQRPTYQAFSLFPPAIRDLAVVVDAACPAGQLQQLIARTAAAQLTDGVELECVELFDIYQGPGIAAGKKSVAAKLTYRHLSRTLTDKEVNGVFQATLAALDARDELEIRR